MSLYLLYIQPALFKLLLQKQVRYDMCATRQAGRNLGEETIVVQVEQLEFLPLFVDACSHPSAQEPDHDRLLACQG